MAVRSTENSSTKRKGQERSDAFHDIFDRLSCHVERQQADATGGEAIPIVTPNARIRQLNWIHPDCCIRGTRIGVSRMMMLAAVVIVPQHEIGIDKDQNHPLVAREAQDVFGEQTGVRSTSGDRHRGRDAEQMRLFAAVNIVDTKTFQMVLRRASRSEPEGERIDTATTPLPSGL
jgi:hypothetical protein